MKFTAISIITTGATRGECQAWALEAESHAEARDKAAADCGNYSSLICVIEGEHHEGGSLLFAEGR